MQEPTLHGWRLADAKHMRMSGYSARVRSLGWTADGEFLATSGSEQLILWPFDGKDGPMGRQPKLLARQLARVAVVAPHPRQPVVAVGYADGRIVLVRIDDGALIEVAAAGASPVTALGLGRRRADLRLRHRGGGSRRFVVLIAAPLRPNNSAAVQLAWTMVLELSGVPAVAVSNSIVCGDPKMINRSIVRRLLVGAATGLALSVAGVALPEFAGGPTAAMAQSADDMAAALDAYGHWVHHARYGEVWVPDGVPPDWQPYEYGHWVYTDDWGWYWVSDDSEDDWGWVVYHYGRWVHDRRAWFWVPGDEWAPAWVDWRYGGDNIGWAPLPPDDLIDAYDEHAGLLDVRAAALHRRSGVRAAITCRATAARSCCAIHTSSTGRCTSRAGGYGSIRAWRLASSQAAPM